ncbi:MAG: NAD(P)H-dependent glycerol-3-phosphate dehydrogenase [Firmicutes bacterium]|nr:NAD(P)H-dependent glycerol-3-phosphate dehydrogenase [Bacillota bacterium]
MNVFVIGCGRWGTFLAWYLNRIGHRVSLYGRAGSSSLVQLQSTRSNGLVQLPEAVRLTDSLAGAQAADAVVISVPSQNLRSLLAGHELSSLQGQTFVLCMKGLEIATGSRLSQIAAEQLAPDAQIAVWLGPGHVQEFTRGVPNCMVIDSGSEAVKKRLVEAFSGDLIRFYYGQDLIGNEIGAAAKNVIGIAAGMLDGKHLSTLKGALMSRGTREIARLIRAMGGSELSAYGLCHLGDYEATVFSPYSHNRGFGEAFVRGESYESLAEGFFTVQALMKLQQQYRVELPICTAVNAVLHEGADPDTVLAALFARSLKNEF